LSFGFHIHLGYVWGVEADGGNYKVPLLFLQRSRFSDVLPDEDSFACSILEGI